MTLLDIRQEVVKQSGRFDLVTDYWNDDFTNNGADFFIQSAQRWLERRPELPMTADLPVKAVFSQPVEQGDWEFILDERVRVVERIEVINSTDDSRGFLTKLEWKELRIQYDSNEDLSEVDQGTPKYFSLTPRRSVDGDDNDLVKKTRRLVTMPPADDSFELKIECMAENRLVEDTDTNFFSLQFPELLISATLWNISKFHKDRAGADDYLTLVEEYLSGIHRDTIRESVADRPEVQPLW